MSLSLFRYSKEANDLIKLAVNGSTEDQVIFCDNPQEKLCHLLAKESINNNSVNLSRCPSRLDREVTPSESGNVSPESNTQNSHVSFSQTCSSRPVVFVNSTEPLENIQAWIDAGAQVIRQSYLLGKISLIMMKL